MESRPTWAEDVKPPRFQKLSGRCEVDVLVIGGGITGISTAFLLKEAGARVAVVDHYKIGGGETGHTTAHVTYVTDSRLSDLVHKVGRAEAQALWDAGEMAMHQIQALARKNAFECGLRSVPGYLFAKETADLETESSQLRDEAHLAATMGFDADFVESVPVFGRPGVRYANQLKFHPIKYLYGLARKIPGDGSHVFEEIDGSRLDPDRRELTTEHGVIAYRSLVIATHMPLQGHQGTLSAALFQTRLAAYSTYAVEGKVETGDEALFWDTADPYLYLRIDASVHGGKAILGGEDHKTGQEPDPEACYLRLLQTFKEIFPGTHPCRRWSGQVIETPDGLPYIGETGDWQFLATGYSGNGITLGTFAAMVIADLIDGRKNPWVELFDPHRKRLSGTWQYIRENKDFPACFLKDHFTPVRDSIADLHPGQGGLVRVDGKKCAAYVEENGKATVLCPVCPHLGCLVTWNGAEETWDCPCHGSRFTATGDILAGPAETGLRKIGES